MTVFHELEEIVIRNLNMFGKIIKEKSGLNAYGVIFDELHAHLSINFYGMMFRVSGDVIKHPLGLIFAL